MSLQKGFSVSIYKNGKYLDTFPYSSQDAMVRDLRQMGASFRNGIFKDLEESSVKVQGRNGFEYEIEEMAETRDGKAIILDGHRYIPIREYCLIKNVSRRKAAYQMDKDVLQGIIVGPNRLRYIRMDEKDGEHRQCR